LPDIHVSASAVIAAVPSVIYALIADYRQGHPSILPPRYFQNLQWTPRMAEARGSRSETLYSKPGLAGGIERWVAPLVLRPVYREELRLLEVQGQDRSRGEQ
jgi:hypothetical protein